MSRQRNQTAHEKNWRWNIHPAIKEFFTTKITSYRDTSSRQNYIGAEAMAFDRRLLPYYLDKGPGEIVLKQLYAGAPQVYVAQAVVPTGIAGIAAGQIWNGTMTDNPLTSGGTGPEIV